MQEKHTGQHPEEVLGGATARLEHGVPGGERDVRGEDHVGAGQQRGKDLRFAGEDVERGAAQRPSVQASAQRPDVGQRAPARVHQRRARLRPGQPGRVHRPPGVRGQRQVQADLVAFGQQHVRRPTRTPGGASSGCRSSARTRPPCPGSHRAVSFSAVRCPVGPRPRRPRPGSTPGAARTGPDRDPGPDVAVRGDDAPGPGVQQADNVVGHLLDAVVRDPGDRDPAGPPPRPGRCCPARCPSG